MVGLKPQGSRTTVPGDTGDLNQYPMTQIASYLRANSLNQNIGAHQDFLSFLYNDSHNINPVPPDPAAHLYNMEVNPNQPNFTQKYTYGDAPAQYFSVRTCNSYFNPQGPIMATNVDPLFLGMASQRCEREDFIITPDLRGNVCSLLICLTCIQSTYKPIISNAQLLFTLGVWSTGLFPSRPDGHQHAEGT